MRDDSGSQRHTVYVFNSLELRRAAYGVFGSVDDADYELAATTEVPYLFANGVRLARVAWEDLDVPHIGQAHLHVLFELGDHLGSTSVVLDKATSELVQRSTFQAYGAAESDYRPGRWGGFREDYRFTGKEEDVEVGLQYFGKRYYAPTLNRWVSADPLALHSSRGLRNHPYSYGGGRVAATVDPDGRDVLTVAAVGFAVGAGIEAAREAVQSGHINIDAVFRAGVAGAGGALTGYAVGAIAGGVASEYWVAEAAEFAAVISGGAVGAGTEVALSDVLTGRSIDWDQVEISAVSGASLAAANHGLRGWWNDTGRKPLPFVGEKQRRIEAFKYEQIGELPEGTGNIGTDAALHDTRAIAHRQAAEQFHSRYLRHGSSLQAWGLEDEARRQDRLASSPFRPKLQLGSDIGGRALVDTLMGKETVDERRPAPKYTEDVWDICAVGCPIAAGLILAP